MTACKRCWQLHECLSNWPDSKVNESTDKTLSLLWGARLLFAFGWRVWRSCASAPPPSRRRRTITNKVLSIIIRQANTHRDTQTHRPAGRQINSECKAKCVRLACPRCALSGFFRCLYPAGMRNYWKWVYANSSRLLHTKYMAHEQT